MTDIQKDNQQSIIDGQPQPHEYVDFDFEDLQTLSDYITRNSVPISMSMIEAQGIVDIYTNFINTSLHNLNLLRALNGDPEFPIPAPQIQKKERYDD